MFESGMFLGLLGSVPPDVPVTTPAIAMVPLNPGDLGTAPQFWTTKVTAAGLSQVKWLVGINGAKTIQFPFNITNNIVVPGYNHGDTINFTGYGSGFLLTKDSSGPNMFLAQGANGFDTFQIGSETQVSDLRYTIEGSGGTGVPAYTLVNLVSNEAIITAQFLRAGDTLIVKSVDESVSTISGSVLFNTPAARSITLTPHDPGNLVNPPANWTTRVNAVGVNEVQWIVLDQNWVGTTGITTQTLANNTAEITCTFIKAGQRLVVKSFDELVQDVSGDVAFSGVVKTLSISPNAPGNLGTAPKPWTTTVTAAGMNQVKWAVFNPDNSSTGPWIVANVGSGGTVSITAQFTQQGQYIQVHSLDDLLSAFSGLVSFNTVPASTSADFQFAYDFEKDLTMGVNVERNNIFGMNTQYFQKLRNTGITHIRTYPASRPNYGLLDYSYWEIVLDAISAGISVGLKFYPDLLDIMTAQECANPAVIPYLNRVCDQIKARNFDPRKIAIGPANEGEIQFNVDYNPYREAWYPGMRSRLPNHILTSSSAYWGDVNTLTDGSMSVFPDKRMIYLFHSYPWNAESISDAQYCANKLSAWADANGVVAANAEYGKNVQNNTQQFPGVSPEWLAQVIYATSRGMPKTRPCLWAITGGDYYRMNYYGTYDLRADVAAAYLEADTYIRSQSWFGT